MEENNNREEMNIKMIQLYLEGIKIHSKMLNKNVRIIASLLIFILVFIVILTGIGIAILSAVR